MSLGLRIAQLNVAYGKKEVINQLDVATLPRGKMIMLLGPNGSGKSTLLRAIAGLQTAYGEVWLDDAHNLIQMPFSERAKRIVYLPQSLPAGIHLQVIESIIAAKQAINHRNQASSVYVNIQKEVAQLLQYLDIDHLAFHHLYQLSGGQKQLVGLAQALIRTPDVLLLDEPLSALDLKYQFHIMNILVEATTQRNMLTIAVVHDINIALRYADHVLILCNGKLIAAAKPQEAITPAIIAKVYGVNGRIESCSCGMRQLIIDSLTNEFYV